MELITDLHIHSRYSRATSKDCTLEGLYRWGKLKGINIIGTGDFTHPAWLAELRGKLMPVEGGLLKLKDDIARDIDALLPESVRSNLLLFVPTVEIATIYRKGDRTRKIHQLVVMPSLASAAALNEHLARIGNLAADGRPVLGMDSKELLRQVLETDPDGLYIPAHIWTPWFGVFGSKSGFDSLAEAYEELAPHITAIETGLSSDPPMNWRLGQLDDIAITSHSDAHSPQKLGREATVLRCQPTYDDLIGAFKTNDRRLAGTIEFFPEEGKYHHDGHRSHGLRLTPAETRAHNGICPVDGKPLTVGVQYRADELADRPLETAKPHPKQVEYIIPLAEILAELRGVKSGNGKAVRQEYDRLIAGLGDEFSILRQLPLDAIRQASPPAALAIGRLRAGQVHREPGYDGIFGVIHVFADDAERQAELSRLPVIQAKGAA